MGGGLLPVSRFEGGYRRKPPRRNGAVEFAKLARAWGDHLRAVSLDRPTIDVGAIPLPAIADADGLLSKSLALLARTIVLQLPRVKNDTKRAAMGALLLALADGLEALQLPDEQPWHLRD